MPSPSITIVIYHCFWSHIWTSFSFLSVHPVTHSFVTQQLKLALAFCDLNPAQYKGHSFRIGAATEGAKLGYSEKYIQQLGRWHSNAIKRYIRINSFSLK